MSNFSVLSQHDEQLLRLGMLAEKYFADDPNTCLLKLRQLAESLTQLLAARSGLYVSPEETQYELLRRLLDSCVLPREVYQIFGEIRCAGNAASHDFSGDHRTALTALKLAWQLSLWFHRTFKDAGYTSGPFIPPQAPIDGTADETADLRAELDQLRLALSDYQATHSEVAEKLSATEARLREAQDEQAFWESMAAETEQAKLELEKSLAAQQSISANQPKDAFVKLVNAANSAASAVQLDEADTRKLIDQQLRQAGWEADSVALKYNKGARPEQNRHRAIAEWPTESGPADYVLFVGLTPVAVVEAKRKNVDVSGALQQAKRYSRTFTPTADTTLPAENWGSNAEYRIPFAFSSNGRPFLRQLATKSGIWFCDLRRADNLGHPLDGWYTPEGLTTLIKRDEARVHEQLAKTPFNYGFPLRHYQQDAILAAEQAIEAGQREMLLAMATGTGKTKTCIALIYRLLKAQRFRRILFLVDRSALGEQAANAFKDTEMTFRGYEDYISKYRRVLDYFDACKIGLTATPALHTTQIFAPPIYTYSYREAVIDGFLVDYEPPVQIKTELSTNGIAWKVGEEVKVYDVRRNEIDLFTTPDEIKLDIDDFNRKVITEAFNRVVCTYLAQELDPASRHKTLIFCATDTHADMVVDLLKKAFAAQYGSVEDDAVIKITGAADKPLQLIRRFKNERSPNVAVTVDLLTTGIDVPEICNLVFLSRVNSRILFDQFLAKLQGKKRHLSEKSARDFESRAGMSPDAFIKKLKAMPIADVAAWFTQNPDLGEILDRKGEGIAPPVLISDHEDALHSAERGYGKAKKPEDYLNEFSTFINSHSNDIPALMTVLTRPRELTRKQLRELALELDTADFSGTGGNGGTGGGAGGAAGNSGRAGGRRD